MDELIERLIQNTIAVNRLVDIVAVLVDSFHQQSFEDQDAPSIKYLNGDSIN